MNINEFEVCIKKLDLHFLLNVSTILERYHFHKCSQKEGQTVEDYITFLRKLFSSCKFAGQVDECIRDQFMIGSNTDKLRDEL